MGLLFAADGDIVNLGSLTVADTAGTTAFWLYPTDNTQLQALLAGPIPIAISWEADDTGDLVAFVSRPTTSLNANADVSALTYWGLNKWVFFAFRWNSAGVNGDQELYCGDLTHAAIEPTSYTLQEVGSGTVNGTGAPAIGNHPVATTREWRGKIATVVHYPRYLSVPEIHQIQFQRKALGGAKFWFEFGLDGTATQRDLSGNGRTGTVTGATLTDHVPLGPLFGFDAFLPTIAVTAPPVTTFKLYQPRVATAIWR